tara:strand:- start:9752 stop:11041 length:1290 start_codon:yes stop_codon:yes gene_type:complete
MKLINNITINKSPMASAKVSRQFIVEGDPGAVFSMTVTNEDSHFYNFSEKVDKNGELETALAFASIGAKLSLKTIGETGTYKGYIEFPAITDDDVYSITLEADSSSNTILNTSLANNNVYVLPNIYKYHDTTVTFSLSSTGSSSSYNSLPSNVTSTGVSNSVSSEIILKTIPISWAVTLSESQFIIAKQPKISDFQFTTTKTSRTTGSSTTLVEVTNMQGLSIGMGISGTGIASGSVITAIRSGYLDANKSSDLKDVYIIPKAITTNVDGGQIIDDDLGGTVTIDKLSSFNAGITLTFTGKGSSASNEFNKTSFVLKNALLTIDPVVTTLDAVASGSTTIPLTSTNGIKAADTVLMTGIGVTATSPHVDTVNAGVSVVVSAAQTIENGQTVTFTGSSRSATITADLQIISHGIDNITLTLALDNILTVA